MSVTASSRVHSGLSRFVSRRLSVRAAAGGEGDQHVREQRQVHGGLVSGDQPGAGGDGPRRGDQSGDGGRQNHPGHLDHL